MDSDSHFDCFLQLAVSRSTNATVDQHVTLAQPLRTSTVTRLRLLCLRSRFLACFSLRSLSFSFVDLCIQQQLLFWVGETTAKSHSDFSLCGANLSRALIERKERRVVELGSSLVRFLAAKIEFSYGAGQTVNLLAYAFSGSNPLLPKPPPKPRFSHLAAIGRLVETLLTL